MTTSLKNLGLWTRNMKSKRLRYWMRIKKLWTNWRKSLMSSKKSLRRPFIILNWRKLRRNVLKRWMKLKRLIDNAMRRTKLWKRQGHPRWRLLCRITKQSLLRTWSYLIHQGGHNLKRKTKRNARKKRKEELKLRKRKKLKNNWRQPKKPKQRVERLPLLPNPKIQRKLQPNSRKERRPS